MVLLLVLLVLLVLLPLFRRTFLVRSDASTFDMSWAFRPSIL
jgi:hypothetical protein